MNDTVVLQTRCLLKVIFHLISNNLSLQHLLYINPLGDAPINNGHQSKDHNLFHALVYIFHSRLSLEFTTSIFVSRIYHNLLDGDAGDIARFPQQQILCLRLDFSLTTFTS